MHLLCIHWHGNQLCIKQPSIRCSWPVHPQFLRKCEALLLDLEIGHSKLLMHLQGGFFLNLHDSKWIICRDRLWSQQHTFCRRLKRPVLRHHCCRGHQGMQEKTHGQLCRFGWIHKRLQFPKNSHFLRYMVLMDHAQQVLVASQYHRQSQSLHRAWWSLLHQTVYNRVSEIQRNISCR